MQALTIENFVGGVKKKGEAYITQIHVTRNVHRLRPWQLALNSGSFIV